MYLAHDVTINCHVFTDKNPRDDGYDGELQENVTLDTSEGVNEWRNGTRSLDGCLGQDPEDDSHYKVFQYDKDCSNAKFHNLGTNFSSHDSWSDYEKIKSNKS